MFTLHVYKFSLSEALILLLDLRSGSTGGGSAVPIDEAYSGGPAVEQHHLQELEGHCWYCALPDRLHTRWSRQLEHPLGLHHFETEKTLQWHEDDDGFSEVFHPSQ